MEPLGAVVPSALITNAGERLLLAAALTGPLFVRLFRNDVPLSIDSQLGDFDPAAFPGYADLDVTGLWPAPSIDSLGRAISILSALTWTRGMGGVPETEFGWLLYRNPSPTSTLVAGQRFTTPYTTAIAGETIVVTILAALLRG